MSKFKVTVDKEKCIGCGSCSAICPANWEMDDQGKASPKEELVEKLGCNQTAAENCPVQAIEVEPIEVEEPQPEEAPAEQAAEEEVKEEAEEDQSAEEEG